MSRNSYISLDEAKHITGRSDTTLLRWYRAGKVRRRMVRGSPYYHAEDLRQRLAEVTAIDAATQPDQPEARTEQLAAPPLSISNMHAQLIDQLADLRAERDQLRQQVADHMQTEASITRDRDRLRVELRLAQAAQAEAESQQARTSVTLAELQSLIDRARVDFAHVQNQRDQARAQILVVQRERDQQRGEREQLQVLVEELEVVKAKLLDELRRLTAQFDERQRQFGMLKHDKEVLNSDLLWLDELIKTMLADPLLAVRKGEYQRRYQAGR